MKQVSAYLSIHQIAQLEEYSKYARENKARVIRKALIYYGIISKDLSKPKRAKTRIKTVFYDMPQDIRVLNIVNIVSKITKTDINNILSTKRHRRYSMPRHAVRYWLRKFYGFTLKESGIAICETDHATAHHSIKKWTHAIETEKMYNKYNNNIISKLYV